MLENAYREEQSDLWTCELWSSTAKAYTVDVDHLIQLILPTMLTTEVFIENRARISTVVETRAFYANDYIHIENE